MTKRALILGASGKIGKHSRRVFEEGGWSVRLYDRSTNDMVSAAQGCDLIINGLNPPNYHDWQTIVPQITRDVIDAARRSGATVLLPGNVYHFGDQAGVWSEKAVPNPISRKGKIRLDMEREYANSGVQTIVLRAGNFIDPDRQGCVMSTVYLRDIERGRITLPGPAETKQAMCYVPDWARAAFFLANMREELSQFEDIPFAGHTLSAEDIKSGIEAILQRKMKFVGFPWLALKITSLFWELAREVMEMRYLWNTDHALCDARFKQLVPDFEVTPLETVLRAALPSSVFSASKPDLLESA